MSERFVRGWKVSPRLLAALVGSKEPTTSAVLASKANARCRSDVFMTLGGGDAEADVAEGKAIAEAALSAILDGRLDRDQADAYARVTELLLNHVGLPLATKYFARESEPRDQILLQATYHVPNGSAGCWNPLLEALKLPKLARIWAADNVHFPWARARGAGQTDWPLWTLIDAPLLPALARELKELKKEHVRALPATLLTDDEPYADETRDELWSGLRRLRAWIDRARAPEKKAGPAWEETGNALLLLMDGDQ